MPITAIVFVVFFCVIVVINKHNALKQKRSQNDVRLRRFGSSFKNCYLFNSKGDNFSEFGKSKVLNCNFARSISRLGIFRCVFIVGCYWLPFKIKNVTF